MKTLDRMERERLEEQYERDHKLPKRNSCRGKHDLKLRHVKICILNSDHTRRTRKKNNRLEMFTESPTELPMTLKLVKVGGKAN